MQYLCLITAKNNNLRFCHESDMVHLIMLIIYIYIYECKYRRSHLALIRLRENAGCGVDGFFFIQMMTLSFNIHVCGCFILNKIYMQIKNRQTLCLLLKSETL